MLPEHPEFTTALEATVLALCTAKLGRVNNDPALVHESLKFYIQGLWELQKALYNPELMYKDETAASCMALIAYEVLECPDKTIKAWIKHVHGCAKLFQMRGPKAYGSEFGHQLFLAFRQQEVGLLIPTLHNFQSADQNRSNKPSPRKGKPSWPSRNGIHTLGKATPNLCLTSCSTYKLR